MPNSEDTYSRPSKPPSFAVREDTIEYGFIGKLQGLKYEYRDDIRDRAALEKNFRERFEALNRVKLTEAEFARLLDEIVTPDVFASCLSSLDALITAASPTPGIQTRRRLRHLRMANQRRLLAVPDF
ncbi:hypothetical protein [Thiobacillus sp.]|uniref:hypothetical protein n=1 Tax=Thiobacillus sp. TaxID=924 RepID=UPI0025D04553|nr:hypothetical protein [Thiobacillus sp.]